jgi:hypothetical protein
MAGGGHANRVRPWLLDEVQHEFRAHLLDGLLRQQETGHEVEVLVQVPLHDLEQVALVSTIRRPSPVVSPGLYRYPGDPLGEIRASGMLVHDVDADTIVCAPRDPQGRARRVEPPAFAAGRLAVRALPANAARCGD